MSDLIDKRNERTRKRKKVKRKMDSIIGLAYHDKDKNVMSLSADAIKLSDTKARLIDEGYIDNGFVIKKGTLEKYLNGENQYVRGWEFDGEHYKQTEVLNLNSDFVGTVNLGHMDFSVMPFILGSWTKDDLTLVDIENDRKALDVTLHLDEESMFVKELKRQEHDIGISAEFWVHQNDEDTEKLSETLGYYLPVFDEIYIFAYGLVGECGNVNSSGLELNKEMNMPKEIKENLETETLEDESLEELAAEDEVEIPVEEPVTEETEAEAEESAETEETAEEQTEEESETQEEESEEEETEDEQEEEEGEEAETEEAEDDISDEGEGDETDTLGEALAIVNDLKEQIRMLSDKISTLEETNASLKKTNRKLSGKLQKENERKAEFMNNVKGLSVELLPAVGEKKEMNKEAVTDRDYYFGDGIGEI